MIIWCHTSLLGKKDGAFAFFPLRVKERSEADEELQILISTTE